MVVRHDRPAVSDDSMVNLGELYIYVQVLFSGSALLLLLLPLRVYFLPRFIVEIGMAWLHWVGTG